MDKISKQQNLFTEDDLNWLNEHGAKRIYPDSDEDYRLSFLNCRIDVRRDMDGRYEATMTDSIGKILGISGNNETLIAAITECFSFLNFQAETFKTMANEIKERLLENK